MLIAHRIRHAPLAALALCAGLAILVASEQTRAAADSHTGAAAHDDTFGIEVADRDDAVVQMLKLAAGLRVMKVHPGSIGSQVTFPGTRRTLGRGDFIIEIRVKGVGADGPQKENAILVATDFTKACARARRVVWEQPGHKGTLLFDVYTQAGYNMEDWKTLTFEAPLDLSGQPEPPPVEAPASAGQGSAGT